MSNPVNENTKPRYQLWSEDAFQGDPDVRYMTAVQRWMYRTLCQEAFFCTTRPYLPDNDDQLWKLAGCESRKQWMQNKQVVRAMFVPIVIDGQKLLSRKRIVEDWAKLQDFRQKQSDKGKKSAAARAHQSNHGSTTAEPRLNTGQPIEVKRSKVKRREVNLPTNPPADGGKAGSLSSESNSPDKDAGIKPAGKEKTPFLKFEDMQTAWTEYRNDRNNFAEALSIGLSKAGFDKLQTNLEAFHLSARVDDVKAAFKRWIEDRYEPTMDTDTKILRPLAVFANDVVQYITTLESHEGKS